VFDLELIYVADPMCSWCWGFAPSIEALADHHPELPIKVVMGGLRPGAAAEALSDGMRSYLTRAWTAVGERSGQPFDHRFLDRDDWVYDTEQAAVAVVAMRQIDESQTLPFLTRVQRAFYAEGVDVTDPGVYPDLVDEFPIDRGEFLTTMESEVTKKLTWDDFSLSRRWGISGFPALLARDGEAAAYLTAGWASPVDADAALHAWLEDRAPGTVEAPSCDLDGKVC
jgi:putative protein-disulfide isomerase